MNFKKKSGFIMDFLNNDIVFVTHIKCTCGFQNVT